MSGIVSQAGVTEAILVFGSYDVIVLTCPDPVPCAIKIGEELNDPIFFAPTASCLNVIVDAPPEDALAPLCS